MLHYRASFHRQFISVFCIHLILRPYLEFSGIYNTSSKAIQLIYILTLFVSAYGFTLLQYC